MRVSYESEKIIPYQKIAYQALFRKTAVLLEEVEELEEFAIRKDHKIFLQHPRI
jgi:hypothetical protein